MKKEKLFSVTKNDLIVQTFKAGGKGGQHQNKTDSGVRIIHKESGASVESRNERSQFLNKKLAFKKLVNHPKFKIWVNRKIFEITNKKSIEDIVQEQMDDKYIKTEIKENGKWISSNINELK